MRFAATPSSREARVYGFIAVPGSAWGVVSATNRSTAATIAAASAGLALRSMVKA